MPARILVVDNYDSFVYTIVGYLAQLGAECDVRRNDAVEVSAATGHDGERVVTGGGERRGK
ncbi:MAG TPA: aminodeoxychorismate/anthranilate synthase component II, partial [Kineosporiaceae bacterium]|nr:aminodeoxychorismate/anthranilate synthase component II [Kineosporiaceae bacterium]